MDSAQLEVWRAALVGLPWGEIKSTAWLVLYFVIALTVLQVLRKLGTIRQIIHDFIEARGPIWDLRSTLKLIDTVPPIVQSMKEQIERLEGTVAATRKQMAEWQIESASVRTDATPTPEAATAPVIAGVDAVSDETNWEKLRDFWRRNTERLEYKIDQIADGRSRLPFDRLPRTNYTKIINRLEARGYITHAAAEASRELNALFNAYRPRNTRVRAEMLGPLMQLDLQLDRELVPYATIQGSDVGDAGETGSREAPAAPAIVPTPTLPLSVNGLSYAPHKPEERPN